MKTEAPAPGVYQGVPFADYCGWDAMNASTLVEGLASMRRLKAKLDGLLPTADSDAMRFGRAVHCRLLEPDDYPTRFPQPERCVGILGGAKKGQQCSSRGRYMTEAGWLCGTHAPEDAYQPPDFVTAEEAEKVERIRENAMAHPEVRNIRRFGGAEVSIVFDLYGVRCKARLDKFIREGGGFVVDVKTFGNRDGLSEARWSRQVADLHYHFKAAFYLSAVKEATGIDADFWHVVVESCPPFDVGAFRLPDFDRQIGAYEVRRLLTAYSGCLESGEWPGAFPELVEHVGLPSWKAKEYASTELMT